MSKQDNVAIDPSLNYIIDPSLNYITDEFID